MYPYFLILACAAIVCSYRLGRRNYRCCRVVGVKYLVIVASKRSTSENRSLTHKKQCQRETDIIN